MKVLIIVVLAWIIFSYLVYQYAKRIEGMSLSIKETVDLFGSPIITFHKKDKKLNFLLDTGCSHSILDKSTYIELGGKIPENINPNYNIHTGNGVISSIGVTSLELQYRKFSFVGKFTVTDVRESFSNAYNDFVVHGVLGNDFLEKYGYIIDYSDLKVKYSNGKIWFISSLKSKASLALKILKSYLSKILSK